MLIIENVVVEGIMWGNAFRILGGAFGLHCGVFFVVGGGLSYLIEKFRTEPYFVEACQNYLAEFPIYFIVGTSCLLVTGDFDILLWLEERR
jgi:hypothetical protein